MGSVLVMMHLAVKTDSTQKNGLDNGIYYSHEIWRSDGFWVFNSVAQQVHWGTHTLFTFLLFHSHYVGYWLQTHSLMVA